MKTIQSNNDQKLESILLERRSPPPSPHLHTRIFSRVMANQPAQADFGLFGWVREIITEFDFLNSRPAYALASVLLVGFILGSAALPTLLAEQQDQSTQIALAD